MGLLKGFGGVLEGRLSRCRDICFMHAWMDGCTDVRMYKFRCT